MSTGSVSVVGYILEGVLSTGKIIELAGRTDVSDRKEPFFWVEDRLLKVVRPEDWYRSREDALARAEEMRAKKIKSLRDQISKLEALQFVIV